MGVWAPNASFDDSLNVSKSKVVGAYCDLGFDGIVGREPCLTLHFRRSQALRKVGKDPMILMLCVTVFLSYLPEAGQYSCFFVYLRLLMGFSAEEVALFIAVVGLLSVIAQTMVLTLLMKTVGSKHTIMVGLLFEMLQLMWYGFGSQRWMMWSAGGLAAVASISYPAISSFVSTHAEADKQGLVQGMITGMRGLCNGLGPAVFGFIFYLFHVDLNEAPPPSGTGAQANGSLVPNEIRFVPGPPFVFGALLVMLALLVAAFIPDEPSPSSTSSSSGSSSSRSGSGATRPHASMRTGGLELFHHDVVHKRGGDCGTLPLMHDTDPL
ncbi:hypothetical protein HPB47_000305 [Ixodes persulcatus]|uniref:Uncharacterized protein n=1 Tax=Ixodes persulcatus TaxID=34615 RepID=A0AC60PS70_IXOPE|nr:hypothetical protein HPB47_000305 [Ixodes persulcatus]